MFLHIHRLCQEKSSLREREGMRWGRKCPAWALPAWQCSLLHWVKQFVENQLGFENAWEITLRLTQAGLRCWTEVSTNNARKHTRMHVEFPATRGSKQLQHPRLLSYIWATGERMSQRAVFTNWSLFLQRGLDLLDSPATSPVSERTNSDRRTNMPAVARKQNSTFNHKNKPCTPVRRIHLNWSFACGIFAESSHVNSVIKTRGADNHLYSSSDIYVPMCQKALDKA